MEEVSCCPVCGGEGTFDIAGYDPDIGVTIRMYSCTRCKTVYHNPRMTSSEMQEYYSSGKYREPDCRHIKQDAAERRLRATIGLVDAFTRVVPKRCLDVGCSRGYLSRMMQNRYGCEVVGYDIYKDPEAVIDVVDSKDKVTGKFDVITCIHVLEHLYDPMDDLTWMAGMLSENGMLMIEIPLARVVTTPHPIIYSREAVPYMMKHIGAEYIFMDMQLIHLGHIMAWKKVESDAN